MKKLICIVLALCLLLALTACGGDAQKNDDNDSGKQEQNNDQNQNTGSDKQDDAANEDGEVAGGDVQDPADEPVHVFTHNGVEIAFHAPAADVIAALGEPKNYTEEASCAFEGLDKTYYYGSFYMQTYPVDGVDYIYSIWFADDTVTTAEGIYIGAAEAQVKTAYGEDAFNGSNAYVITKGKSQLTVKIEGGVVSDIMYMALHD